jgi:hypothetical protein
MHINTSTRFGPLTLAALSVLCQGVPWGRTVFHSMMVPLDINIAKLEKNTGVQSSKEERMRVFRRDLFGLVLHCIGSFVEQR